MITGYQIVNQFEKLKTVYLIFFFKLILYYMLISGKNRKTLISFEQRITDPM